MQVTSGPRCSRSVEAAKPGEEGPSLERSPLRAAVAAVEEMITDPDRVEAGSLGRSRDGEVLGPADYTLHLWQLDSDSKRARHGGQCKCASRTQRCRPGGRSRAARLLASSIVQSAGGEHEFRLHALALRRRHRYIMKTYENVFGRRCGRILRRYRSCSRIGSDRWNRGGNHIGLARCRRRSRCSGLLRHRPGAWPQPKPGGRCRRHRLGHDARLGRKHVGGPYRSHDGDHRERAREPRPRRQGLARAVPAAPVTGLGNAFADHGPPLRNGRLRPPACWPCPAGRNWRPGWPPRLSNAPPTRAGPTTSPTGRVRELSLPVSSPTGIRPGACGQGTGGLPVGGVEARAAPRLSHPSRHAAGAR